MRSLKEVLIKFHDMYEEFYWSVAIVHQHLTKLDILGEYETMDEVNLYLTDYYVALLDRYCKYFENPVDIDRFRNVELTLKDGLDEEELIWEFLYWFRLFILSDYKSVWNDPMRINYVYYLKTLYWNLAAFAVCNDEELEQRERDIKEYGLWECDIEKLLDFENPVPWSGSLDEFKVALVEGLGLTGE